MKLGTGMPAFNNDEIIIPSFIDLGVKEEDAYNYSAIGCVETAVPGNGDIVVQECHIKISQEFY